MKSVRTMGGGHVLWNIGTLLIWHCGPTCSWGCDSVPLLLSPMPSVPVHLAIGSSF